MTPPDLKKLIEADIAERAEFGMRKYGEPLRIGQKDLLREAYAEALDMAFYLRLLLLERDGQ